MNSDYPPLTKNLYFRIVLGSGIFFFLIYLAISSYNQNRECGDVYIRYCDYMDPDISVCFRDKEIYCCHDGNNDHYWNRPHYNQHCGHHNNCYRIVEESD
jgi:hypothetical protein